MNFILCNNISYIGCYIISHFSKKEIEHLNINNHRRVAEYFIGDRRSNHLGDQRMHDALYNIVCDFAQGRIAGQINLNYRLNNGS